MLLVSARVVYHSARTLGPGVSVPSVANDHLSHPSGDALRSSRRPMCLGAIAEGRRTRHPPLFSGQRLFANEPRESRHMHGMETTTETEPDSEAAQG